MSVASDSICIIEMLEGRRFCDGTDLNLQLEVASGSASGADSVSVTGSGNGTYTDGATSATIRLEFVTQAVETDGSIEAQSASASFTLKDTSDPNFTISLGLSFTYGFTDVGGAGASIDFDSYFKKAFSTDNATASGSGSAPNGTISVTSNTSSSPTTEFGLDVHISSNGPSTFEASVVATFTLRW